MILIIFLIFLIIYLFYNNENFININESLYIDYNVIHVKNTEKKNNIINNEQILGKKINIFNGIKGDDINLNKLDMYDPNIKLNYTFKTKNELGCYLSHFLLIKNALKSKKKYTVIFEDDFTIETRNLHQEILDIIEKVDDNFDIIYLGNLYESKSVKIIDNIYKKSNIIPLIGAHALLINNKNAKKIFDYIVNINCEIDIKLSNLIDQNKINYYIIYPSLVNQNNNFKSSLRSKFYILRRNILQTIQKIFNEIID